jgi:hypothetical protein
VKNQGVIMSITVKSQKELDAIPVDTNEKIYIEFGTYFTPAIVRDKYKYSVVAWGNSSVEARGNSSVVARGNSSVVAWGNSSVEAWGNSSVVAWGNSSVVARGNSSVEAWGNSSVVAWENSSVVARGNSSVVARENSSVVARENSSVVARGNVQVVDCLQGAKIQIFGNARTVFYPRNIHEFMDFYGIKHDKKRAIFYKAVHKVENEYQSDFNPDFTYKIGEFKGENICTDITENCGEGIHISTLQFALEFGCDWKNLAILEVETEIDDIVLPKSSNGKVRTSKIKVLREVPLSECGIYGKILAERQNND